MRKNKGLNIVMWTLIVGVMAALGTFFFIQDNYNAKSTIEIRSPKTQDNLIEAMKSDQISEKVIEDNNLTLSAHALKQSVKVTSDNRQYQLNVSYNNKQDSTNLTNLYTTTVEQELGNIIQVNDIKILSLAKEKNVKNLATLPRVFYIGAGLLIGALIGLLINAIKNPKNKKRDSYEKRGAIAKYPVLGTIRIY